VANARRMMPHATIISIYGYTTAVHEKARRDVPDLFRIDTIHDLCELLATIT
jgi:hypothetical protein